MGRSIIHKPSKVFEGWDYGSIRHIAVPATSSGTLSALQRQLRKLVSMKQLDHYGPREPYGAQQTPETPFRSPRIWLCPLLKPLLDSRTSIPEKYVAMVKVFQHERMAQVADSFKRWRVQTRSAQVERRLMQKMYGIIEPDLQRLLEVNLRIPNDRRDYSNTSLLVSYCVSQCEHLAGLWLTNV